MTSKERVITTMEFQEPDRVPRWLGASPEFISKAIKEFGLKDEEDLMQMIRAMISEGCLLHMCTTIYKESNITPFGLSGKA